MKPDRETLYRQCQIEHIHPAILGEMYGITRTRIYGICREYGFKPWAPRKYAHIREIPLSAEQHQIVLGTLLGDGNITIYKNHRPYWPAILRMTHGAKQKDYLQWKKDRLSQFFTRDEPSIHIQRHYNPGALAYRYDSVAHPAFGEYRNLFYQNGKKHVSKNILERLDDLAVAVWFMDDGSYQKKSGWAMLATHSFSKEENELIAQWFESSLGIVPRVYPNRKLNQWFICFNKPAVEALRIKIAGRFYNPLLYKLGL